MEKKWDDWFCCDVVFFIFVFNVLDDNQLDRQQQKFKLADRDGLWHASRSIDQFVATSSSCCSKWTRQFITAANITKISFIYMKRHNQSIPKVSVRMKDQQESQIWTNEKEKTANFYQFNCHRYQSDTVEIVLLGLLFDCLLYTSPSPRD